MNVGTPPAWKPERRFEGESQRIEETAARWVVLLDGEPSASHMRELSEWLAVRARHRAAFLRLSVAWRQMDRLRALPGDQRPLEKPFFPVAVYIVTFVVAATLTAFILALWLR
jgi:ferric-dicitrate binding protein FerR (iron transport regulator)